MKLNCMIFYFKSFVLYQNFRYTWCSLRVFLGFILPESGSARRFVEAGGTIPRPTD
ncbi:hypothetical protein CN210_09275 [Sinorhizobium meliloti]|nr:hypothetical protein CN210_09275 [Sinorhizobium meliloti]